MKPAHKRQKGKAAFVLIEEATHLLRTALPSALAVYYLGTIPFVLTTLYFWADMSRSPFAYQHRPDAALGLTAAFFWAKYWQVIFTRRIRAQAAAEPQPHWTARRSLRTAVTQMTLQPFGLFVIPLSLLPMLPFAWVYTFFQNITVLDDGDTSGTSSLLKKSWKQATFWPGQNHLVLTIMLVFGLCVFLNWTVVCLVIPKLLKMLFGIESVFTRSPFNMLNTTFFAAMTGLTYLCVDPIMKIIYVLRCFYGESLQSGEDLKSEIRSFAEPSVPAAVALAVFLGFLCLPASATDAASPAATQHVAQVSQPAFSPSDLDQAINRTIHQRKYTWRMPREKIPEDDSQEGVLARFFNRMGSLLRNWARAIRDFLDYLWRKLFPPSSRTSSSESSGGGWIVSLKILLYGLITAAVIALVVFLVRVWRGRPQTIARSGEPIQPAPDLTDENVRADQLPEDGWTKLARELMERGEFRLAMRALYFAMLSHLAARGLIRIAPFKSNRDYERELIRRGHSFGNLPAVFGDSVSIFERIWYGTHEANRDLVNKFAAGLERMRAAG